VFEKKKFNEADETIDQQLSQRVRLSYKCTYTTANPAGHGQCCGKKLESLNKIANHIRKEHSLPQYDKNLAFFYMVCNNKGFLGNPNKNPGNSNKNFFLFFFCESRKSK
jgi:hypothetical protein